MDNKPIFYRNTFNTKLTYKTDRLLECIAMKKKNQA